VPPRFETLLAKIPSSVCVDLTPPNNPHFPNAPATNKAIPTTNTPVVAVADIIGDEAARQSKATSDDAAPVKINIE
jgi:hypothetical protein